MKMDEVSSFTVYYGSGRENELARYDLAVIEASGHEKTALERLRRSGTLLLSYLSFIEVSPESVVRSELSEKDFLDNGGQPLINAAYGNLLADFSSEKWQSLLMDRIMDLHLNLGFDGIFIDTLADIEYFSLPESKKDALLYSAADFLRRLRGHFPELILVQNNGTGFLYHYTACFLSGICVENPPALDVSDVEKLRYLKEKFGMKIFMLTDGGYDPVGEHKVKAAAQENGFLYYRAENGYLDL